MRAFRILARSIALGIVTLGLWLVWLAGSLPARALGRASRWRARTFGAWARTSARVIGLTVRVEGPPPEGAFLLVTNHLGYLDIVLLASRLSCVFVSKAEVRSWPVLGFMSRSMGTIYLDRTRKRDLVRVGREIEEALEAGEGVVLFPEGTSTQGADVRPFRSSLLEVAARRNLPVRYAALRYSTGEGDPPAHRSVAWWGDATFGPHFLALLGVSRIEATVSFGDEPVAETDRKLLARRLHEEVEGRFVPMTAFAEEEPLPRPGVAGDMRRVYR